ncbi:MFS transporter small subunit [Escherichia coli]|uniref:MFS transporter small subunit n=1 Tax=Escherichia coli TaxID=562 RepID=UPI00159B96FD|nr:hypothetical protein [Escherichia coli]NVL83954.1 hypothetical protein [Escherichia coli]
MVERTGKKSSTLAIAAAWIVVLVPIAWGFNFTLANAMKLFTAHAPPSTAPHTR